MKGRAITFGNNIDTDQIIGAHHLTLPSIDQMATYTFENYPDFTKNFERGDIIVGTDNFGCGSSREQAPAVLKARGVQAIVAKNFARIFYRNSINLGLPLIECAEADKIRILDRLELKDGFLLNHSQEEEYSVQPYPAFIQQIFESGGIVPHLLQK